MTRRRTVAGDLAAMRRQFAKQDREETRMTLTIRTKAEFQEVERLEAAIEAIAQSTPAWLWDASRLSTLYNELDTALSTWFDREAYGYHAFVNDGEGRCAVRPLGGGRFPTCGQWAGNAVHTEGPGAVDADVTDARDRELAADA